MNWRAALNPGVEPRELLAWSMYDFANSGFTTVVLTAVFNAYFVGSVAGDASWATFAWTAALAVSSLLFLLTMPALARHADKHGAKKRLLAISTVICVVATALLATVGPGAIVAAVVLVVVANWAFNIGEALAGAFLPELARPQHLGRVSGWGWSFGYFGGMTTLGLSLVWVIAAQARGEPASQFVPVTMLITAGVFALAAFPVFVVLRERAPPRLGNPSAAACAARQAPDTATPLGPSGGWRRLADFIDFRRLLICGVFYQAGIAVVIALAAVYAERVMGFSQTETMSLIFIVNIASALGAFAFGHVQDRLGHRRALAVTLLGWILMIVLAGTGETRPMFWTAAALAGLCMGSSQSCGRAMVGALAPADRLAEFFGMWGLAVRVAAVIGPLAYGAVTWLSQGNHRMAILATGLFFIAGLVLLRGIDMQRGASLASAQSLAGGTGIVIGCHRHEGGINPSATPQSDTALREPGSRDR